MLNIVAAVPCNLAGRVAALWIGANLSTAEKRLLYRPKRLYASGDPDFRRALGILLGPPLVSGNRITTLINEIESFRRCSRRFAPPGPASPSKHSSFATDRL
jgi:hypothetical protein